MPDLNPDFSTINEWNLRSHATRMESIATALYGATDRISERIRSRLEPHGDVPTNALDAKLLSAELATDFKSQRHHHFPRETAKRTVSFDSRRRAREYAQVVARREILTETAPFVLASRVQRDAGIVKGDEPIKDASGNVLSGQAARTARAQLSHYWWCEVEHGRDLNGKNRLDRRTDHAIRLYLEAQVALSEDLEVAKEQLLERCTDLIEGRCMYLFLDTEPQNQDQQNAKYQMLKARRTLYDALQAATTIDGAKLAATTASNAVEAVNVKWSPQVYKGTTHVKTAELAETYSRGPGAWGVVLNFRNTGGSPQDHGKVTVDLPSSDDFQFSVTRQTDYSVSVAVSRKGTGHPDVATHTLMLSARNHKGVVELDLDVTVPAETPVPTPTPDESSE